MKNRTVIILASSRSFGNTRKIVEAVSNQQIDIIDLNTYSISYYDYNHKNRNDDFLELIMDIIGSYDHIILASPIYWYTVSAQMKCFIDRFTDLLTIEKDWGRKLRGKKMSLISCSNADDFDGDFAKPIRSTAEYLGMHFITYLHTWLNEDGSIGDEVNNKIEDFRSVILN